MDQMWFSKPMRRKRLFYFVLCLHNIHIQLICSMNQKLIAMEYNTQLWDEMHKFISETWQDGHNVSHGRIQIFTLQMTKKMNIVNFKASAGWCTTRFMKRHNLVLRQKRKISQHLPANCNTYPDPTGSMYSTRPAIGPVLVQYYRFNQSLQFTMSIRFHSSAMLWFLFVPGEQLTNRRFWKIQLVYLQVCWGENQAKQKNQIWTSWFKPKEKFMYMYIRNKLVEKE